jgi:hypothetical protein
MTYLQDQQDLRSFFRRLRHWADSNRGRNLYGGVDKDSWAWSLARRMPLGNTGCSYSVRSRSPSCPSGPPEKSCLRCVFGHGSDDKFAERRRPTFRTNKIFDPSFDGFANGLIVIRGVTFMRCVSFFFFSSQPRKIMTYNWRVGSRRRRMGEKTRG